MKSPTLISLPNEPCMEKWARLLRFSTALPYLRQALNINPRHKVVLIDFGCGQDILLYNYLERYFAKDIQRIQYVGIDPLIPKSKAKRRKNITLISTTFEKSNDIPKADIITMFAVLEHVDDEFKLLESALKALCAGGVIILTTPSPFARFFLEFFAYRIGTISRREIDEHKRYPTRHSLLSLVKRLERKGYHLSINHIYFELGLNNLLIIHKQK